MIHERAISSIVLKVLVQESQIVALTLEQPNAVHPLRVLNLRQSEYNVPGVFSRRTVQRFSIFSLGGGLEGLPLRVSNEIWFIWSISSIWLVWLVGPDIHPEEPDRPANQTDEPVRVARAQKIIRLHPTRCSGDARPTWERKHWSQAQEVCRRLSQ
jgi:hypothetical protein